MKNIYLDNAATTPVDERVVEAMIPFLRGYHGNPSSVHSFGKPVKVMVEEARETVADFIGAKPKEIFFTSGGTEANNFAIKGLVFRHLSAGENHIITSSVEHPAVLDTVTYLNERFGTEFSVVKPDKDGRIRPDEIEKCIRKNTLLLSIMHSNNETGIINDLKKISEIADRYGVFVHTDSVQSIGKTKFNVKELNVNFASSSAHKFYGPKGIGFLYIKDGTPSDKFMHGGSQERNMRGGTENTALIAGLKKAVEILNSEMETDIKIYSNLKKTLINLLNENYGDKIFFNSKFEDSLPNIINVSFIPEKFKSIDDTLLISLDIKGVAVSGGSACSSGSLKPSRILLEMGLDEKTAMASLRISFGRRNTVEDINYFMETLKSITG